MDRHGDPEQQLSAFAGYEHAVVGLQAGTVRNHLIYLRSFAAWWRSARPAGPLSAAAPVDVAAFLLAEAQRGLAPRTRRAELAALRRFFDWCVLTGVAATNPATVLPTPRAAPLRPQVYTAAQSAAILRHTATLTDRRGRQRHVLVSALRWTGMRSAELRHLRLEDVDPVGGWARVVGKGSRERTVLLPPPLLGTLTAFLRELRPQLGPSPLLLVNTHPFVTTAHRGFGQEALAREVELAGQGAAVPGRHHPHKWRHTFATELARAGVEVHLVQRLLGHRSIASTADYTHLSLADVRARLPQLWPPP